MKQMRCEKREEKKSGFGKLEVNYHIDSSTEKKQELKKMRLPRTSTYLREINGVDQLTDNDCKIIESIKKVAENNKLLGVLAECQLSGHIIHAIDKYGNIIQHYRAVSDIPEELRCGYTELKENKGCMAVEVYTNTICIVFSDGSVKIVEREWE